MKRVIYLPPARKALLRHRADAPRIMTRIAAYAADPATQANNVKRLKGRPAVWRLRVGDYRVLFSGDAECTLVVDIGPRGAIYE